MGLTSSLNGTRNLLFQWHLPLRNAIAEKQKSTVTRNVTFIINGESVILLLSAQKLAAITIENLLQSLFLSPERVPSFLNQCLAVGEAIFHEVQLAKKTNVSVFVCFFFCF